MLAKHRTRPSYRWSVDVTVYVSSNAIRKDIETALYRTPIDILKLQGFRAAFAGITLPNPGSVALHEAFGFTQVGAR